MLTQVFPASIAAIKALSGCPARGPTKLAAVMEPCASTPLNLPGINTIGGANQGKLPLFDFMRAALKRSVLRHTLVFSLAAVSSIFIFYLDVNSLGGSMSDALALALPLLVTIIGVT